MKKYAATYLFYLIPVFLFSQEKPLPYFSKTNNGQIQTWGEWTTPFLFSEIYTDPPAVPVRHFAEWEELEAIVIAWYAHRSVLKEIVRHAKEEVRIIITYDSTHTDAVYNSKTKIEEYLINNDISLENVEIIHAKNNSEWTRDYLQNTVYANDVGDRFFTDWVYDRQRPDDDTMSHVIAEYLNTPLYSMSEMPYRLASAGGNFMSDGLGTAFSSTLVFETNETGNEWNAGPHDETAIDSIHQLFLGISRYIKFPKLQFDIIHHIDMHMHLLDEETILWGQYPDGVSDGPQIEANIQYLLDNFDSPFGTPYQIERIVQPPDGNGNYPDGSGNIHLRNYTNFVFINKTIIVPQYNNGVNDSLAIDFFKNYFPGYKIVGIDCNSVIAQVGALHCIAKEIGVKDPLWIVHQRQRNIEDNEDWGDYEITANIQHRTGIIKADLFWTTDTTVGYDAIIMELIDTFQNKWSALIPHQEDSTEIFYYIRAEANSGKSQVRPLPAPKAYYKFWVNNGPLNTTQTFIDFKITDVYPNPTNGEIFMSIFSEKNIEVDLSVHNSMGRKIKGVFKIKLAAGKNDLDFNLHGLNTGIYFIQIRSGDAIVAKKFTISH